MYIAIYGVIIFVATLLGAFVGLGGGVIIKPLLDLIGHDTIDVVNFISTCAVFSMSISATVKHIMAKTKIKPKFVLSLSIGAVVGGVLGARLFDYMLSLFDNDILKGIQGIILGVLLVLAVIYVNLKNAKSLKIENPAATILIGLLMGGIAAFLGVGGGPINVAFLMLFFGLSIKESAVYSVCTIFFSQLSKLCSLAITGNIPSVSPLTIICAIACAVLGGILGAKINKIGNEKAMKIVFSAFVGTIAIINFYNGFTGLI